MFVKPNEFYIGVLDFFAIILPGAVATAILYPILQPWLEGPLEVELSTMEARTAAFLVGSYFVGHLIFLVGSWIDPLYNVVRKRCHPYNNESAFKCAEQVRDSIIGTNEQAALNVFQWSRSVLLATCPAAAEDVHRLEADSKFFRSVMVVLLIATIAFFVRRQWVSGAVSLVFVVACFCRYYERRLKSTTQAYLHILTLNRLGRLKFPAAD